MGKITPASKPVKKKKSSGKKSTKGKGKKSPVKKVSKKKTSSENDISETKSINSTPTIEKEKDKGREKSGAGKPKQKKPQKRQTDPLEFYKLMSNCFVYDNQPDIQMVIKGQYKAAFELLEDAQACQLTPILIGPPGTGKTLLARTFAASQNRDFEWMTMDEATKPSHFIGSFDPGETLKHGFKMESFLPGPLTKMMITGGIYLANELNRATEYCQNTFLEPLEERSVLLPRLGRIKAVDSFFLICAANPGDMAGTHRISEALKDRIKVWIKLDYPNRAVEMDIIHANIPQSKLSKDYLNLTYELIAATRKSREIERPASIRSAIAIAKLSGEKKRQGNLSMREFQNIAKLVLVGGIKPRPGHKPENIISKIVKSIAK